MVLLNSVEDLSMLLTCDKREGWTVKSILTLKMMKEEDELDYRDHC